MFNSIQDFNTAKLQKLVSSFEYTKVTNVTIV